MIENISNLGQKTDIQVHEKSKQDEPNKTHTICNSNGKS